MSESTETKNLADYFASHLVVILYRHDTLDGHGKPIPNQTTMGNGSAFVMEHKGFHFLLTAGHVLHEIDRLIALPNGRVRVDLMDGLGWKAEHHTPYFFPYSAVLHKTIGNGDDIDYGIIGLNKLTIEALTKNGVRPVSASEPGFDWLQTPTQYDRYMMVGTPQDLIEVVQQGGLPASATVGAVLLEIKPTDSPPAELVKPFDRFYGTVDLPDGDDKNKAITTVKGMSGAPVFGIKRIDGRLRYWFYAIQSGWHRPTNTIAACPFAPFAKHLTNSLDEAMEAEAS